MEKSRFEKPSAEKLTFEEVLDRDGVLVFTNKGVSMEPLIHQGRDLMIIKKRDPKQRCKKYDVVFFRRDNDQHVVHRILKLLPEAYWIVGDNCISGEYVREEQVLGILSGVKRKSKNLDFQGNFLYWFYVHTWCACYPLRFFILKRKNFLLRCLSWLKRHL